MNKKAKLSENLVRTKIEEYRKNTFLNKSELDQIKLKKFRSLVRHVNNFSPYYKNIIQERKIDVNSCNPSDFPILTKTSLIENFNEIVTNQEITKEKVQQFLLASNGPLNLFNNNYLITQTSGSSGENLCFVQSIEEYACSAAQLLRFSKFPEKDKFVKAAFVGITKKPVFSIIFTSLLNDLRIGEFEQLDINVPTQVMVETLNQFQPTNLSGYTSGILSLARSQSIGKLKIRPMAVSCGGEVLRHSDRIEIESAFDCVLQNTYGTTEFGIMGISLGENMLLLEDDLIIEFCGDSVNVTNLFLHTLPLIRYQISDALVKIDGPGVGPYSVISSQFGRSEANLVLRNEAGKLDSIHALALVGLSLKFSKVARYQFVVTREKSFIFRFAFSDNVVELEKPELRLLVNNTLSELLNEKHMRNVSFKIDETTETLIDSRTGKMKMVVNHL